jgi:hypothetical protein
LKEYEHEISQLENQRGNSVRWVRPDPGFVVKTTLDLSKMSKNPEYKTSSGTTIPPLSSEELKKNALLPDHIQQLLENSLNRQDVSPNEDTVLKVFINICSSSEISPPSASPSTTGIKKGQNWSIPLSLSPPREDFDHGWIFFFWA